MSVAKMRDRMLALGGLLPVAVIVLALVFGAPATTAADVQARAPASAQLSPKVLQVVAAVAGVATSPQAVGLASYTLQIHNEGQYAVRITIGRLLNVYVPPNGWRFRVVSFSRQGSYIVKAVNAIGASSAATFGAQR